MAGQDIPAVGESLTIDALFEKLASQTIRNGDLVTGKVGAIEKDFATIQCDDFEGLVSLAEDDQTLQVGEEYEFFVDAVSPKVLLSLHKGQRLSLWNRLEALKRAGDEVQVTVTTETRGDLFVELMGLRAILPFRELQPGRPRDIAALTGSVIPVRIIHIRERKNQIIVSERALHQGDEAERKAATLMSLEVDQVLEGEVMRLTHFGAFLDIGGLDGLLHVKDMSWRRLKEPSEAVRVGDFVNVKVLEFDREKEKVSLGLKQMSPDPWLDAVDRYLPGHEVNGKVVGITDFGAFVMLSDGIEGLVHLSEMSWTDDLKHPSIRLKRGQELSAWVVRCEPDRRRLGLTLKNPAESPWLAVRERLPVGSKLSTQVVRVADFGIFVDLGDGLHGLVHASDFSWGSVDLHPSKRFQPGENVEVMVLDIDAERGRASLGIKQLSEDLTSELMRKYALGDVVQGSVSSLQDEGIFVELEPGLEGLMHIVSDAEQLPLGHEVTVRVTGIDLDLKRLTLTMQVAAPDAAQGSGGSTKSTPPSSAAPETVASVDSVVVPSESEGGADEAEVLANMHQTPLPDQEIESADASPAAHPVETKELESEAVLAVTESPSGNSTASETSSTAEGAVQAPSASESQSDPTAFQGALDSSTAPQHSGRNTGEQSTDPQTDGPEGDPAEVVGAAADPQASVEKRGDTQTETKLEDGPEKGS